MSELPASSPTFAPRDSGQRSDALFRAARAARWREHDTAAMRDASQAQPLHGSALKIDCAGIGGAVGGTVGVVVAAVTAMDSLTIAALGIVLAGPLAAALMGAALGALAGALVGAWVDADIAQRDRVQTHPGRAPTTRRPLGRDMAA